jgi:hypothetical protein
MKKKSLDRRFKLDVTTIKQLTSKQLASAAGAEPPTATSWQAAALCPRSYIEKLTCVPTRHA